MGFASLAVKNSQTFNFVGVTTEDGRVPDRLIRQAEQIASAAVDGDRWQVNRRAYRPFKMESLADTADDAAALALASIYEDSAYLLATLTITRPAGTKTWPVIILDVRPQVLPGQIFGAGATGTRGVRATWTLQVCS